MYKSVKTAPTMWINFKKSKWVKPGCCCCCLVTKEEIFYVHKMLSVVEKKQKIPFYFPHSSVLFYSMEKLVILNRENVTGGWLLHLHRHLWLLKFMDCSLPGSSVHGIILARILECVAISFFRGSSRPRDQTCISWIGRQILYHSLPFFTTVTHEKPQSCLHNVNNDHHERGQWLYNWYIKSSEYEIYKRKLNVLFYPCSSHIIIDDSLYFSRRTRQPYTKIFRSIKNPVMP